MSRWWILPLVAWMELSCGSIRSGNNPGAPLAVVDIRTKGDRPPNPPRNLRAHLFWEWVQPSPLLDCVNRHGDQYMTFDVATQGVFGSECMELKSATAVTHQDIEWAADIRDASRIILDDTPAPPTPEQSLLAFGRLVLFDDQNANRTLDVTTPSASHAVDLALAHSAEMDPKKIQSRFAQLSFSTPNPQWIKESPQRISGVVYRAGALHPFWRVYASMGCPEPQEGFSLFYITIGHEELRCELDSALPLDVTFSDTQARWAVCPEPPARTPNASSYPDKAPPSNARVSCSPDSASLSFYPDQGAYCDAAFVQCAALEGCRDPVKSCVYDPLDPNFYQLLDAPPSWWPCKFNRACKNQDGEFKGTFQSGNTGANAIDVVAQPSLFSGPEGLRIFATFGPAESPFKLTVIVNADVELGRTYAGNERSSGPVGIIVTRERPASDFPFFTEYTYELTAHAYSLKPCGANVFQLSNLRIPADTVFEEMRINGTIRFQAPE